jgi:hypothetical protein
MTKAALNVIDLYMQSDFCRGGNGENEDELLTDRALVAAAPALLAICQYFVSSLDQGDFQDLNERTYTAMIAVIAKAKEAAA